MERTLTRYNFILVILVVAGIHSGCISKPDVQDTVGLPPNFLIILVDDMDYSDISCFGSEIPTPHIDRLASEGMRMTQFYNAARCCPSRASLLTGLYPHQAGMGHQNQDRHHPSYRGKITNNAATMAELLNKNGYTTYHVGKWHVGSQREYWPDKKGFDQYFTLIEGAMNYYNQWPWLKNQDSLEITYNGTSYRTRKDFYATKTFSDTACAFIARHDPDMPFLMYLAYNAPHWPLHAPKEDIDRFRGKYMSGWDTIRQRRMNRMKELGIIDQGIQLSERFHSVPEWNMLDENTQKNRDHKMALYAAVMDNLDRGIGRVIQTLRKTGQLDRTMILFLSDNGGCHEDPVPGDAPWVAHPLDGPPGSARSFPSYGIPWANVSNTPFSYFKSYVHEGGIATPLIVRYPPLVPAGSINTGTVGHIIDLLPTILDLAGISYPEEIDDRRITPLPGITLLPALSGEEQTGHELLFWEHQFNRAVRQGDWKLVSPYKILETEGIYNEWELYDLSSDPVEQVNLAKEYPHKVLYMSKLYEEWADKLKVLNPEEMKELQQKNTKQTF